MCCRCRSNATRIVITIVYGDRLSAAHNSLYPVNTLRNAALDAVKSEFVFGLDADFIVGGDLSTLPVPAEKTLYVLPCFRATADRKEEEGEAWPTSKEALVRWRAEGRVAGYDAPDWPFGHMDVEYDRWYTAKQHYQVMQAYATCDLQRYLAQKRRTVVTATGSRSCCATFV